MHFEANQDPAAIAEMETLLRDAPASDETRNIKLALAKMLDVTGNTCGRPRPRRRGAGRRSDQCRGAQDARGLADRG